MDPTDRVNPDDPTVGAALGIAQALASRLCHDLVSPVGAITNGVDLIRELGGSAGAEEIAMIGQSADRANDVLSFHRLAFGATAAESSELGRPALARTLSRMLSDNRVRCVLSGEDGPPLPRRAARAIALAALCARRLIPFRGRIDVDLAETAILPVRIGIEGADPDRRAEALAWLDAESPRASALQGPLDPREIEYALCPVAAAQAGAVIDIAIDSQSPRFTLRAA
ncbi:MAG: histidine phosphotransferase family protein [Pikeienuella sp.]